MEIHHIRQREEMEQVSAELDILKCLWGWAKRGQWEERETYVILSTIKNFLNKLNFKIMTGFVYICAIPETLLRDPKWLLHRAFLRQ